MNKAIRDYMAEIGSKGGKASTGTKAAQERSRKANAARWAKHRAKKAKEDKSK